jgi:transcriptional regulator with XRE-family HTH domain
MRLENGRDLRAFREEAGVTLVPLSDLVGLSTSDLSLIERGYKPMPTDLPERYYKAILQVTNERMSRVLAAARD